MLFKYYAWEGETVCYFSKSENKKSYGRKIKIYSPYGKSNYNTDFEKLPVVVLFDKIAKLIRAKNGEQKLSAPLEILNENSTEQLTAFAKNKTK